MQLKNSLERFGAITKTFHWLIFILITTQLYLIWMFETLSKEDPSRGQYMFFHKAVGATVLMVAILWIIWRWFNVLPAPKPSRDSWQHKLAKFTHTCLLIGIVILPLSGALMSLSAGRAIDWFGIFTIPVFSFVPQSEALAGFFKSTHQLIAFVLVTLVGLHIVGALIHHFIYKDNVMRRMLPWVK